jgi:hypothetical protein
LLGSGRKICPIHLKKRSFYDKLIAENKCGKERDRYASLL